MSSVDLEQATSAQIAGDVQAGTLSAVEVTTAYLDRIEQLNGTLGGYITVTGDRALEVARAADRMPAGQRRSRPLHGVPFAVKDQFMTKGIRTTGGSEVLRDYVPTETATVVARLEAAGAILLGKLNMTQFAAGMDDRYPYLEPRNPWDLSRTPGNSSGGSALAVAASLASFTLGEDTGGSIRGPASSCGVVGMRPSWGRVSRYGMLPFCWSMDTAGPMSRTVHDNALVLSVIAGRDECDPSMSTDPVPSYAEAMRGDIVSLRAALVDEWMDPATSDAEVIAAVDAAVNVLEGLGMTVDRLSWPRANDLGPVVSVISESDGAFVHRERLRRSPEKYGNNIRRRLLAGALIPSQVLQKAVRLRAIFRAEWMSLFDRYDVILSPSHAQPAAKISYVDDGVNSLAEAERRFVKGRNQRHPAAIAGTPALSVPCGATKAGLPIGLQIMTRAFDETTAYRVGSAFEGATSWHRRRPPALFALGA